MTFIFISLFGFNFLYDHSLIPWHQWAINFLPLLRDVLDLLICVQILVRLDCFCLALQWKCENLLGEKQSKFTEFTLRQGFAMQFTHIVNITALWVAPLIFWTDTLTGWATLDVIDTMLNFDGDLMETVTVTLRYNFQRTVNVTKMCTVGSGVNKADTVFPEQDGILQVNLPTVKHRGWIKRSKFGTRHRK